MIFKKTKPIITFKYPFLIGCCLVGFINNVNAGQKPLYSMKDTTLVMELIQKSKVLINSASFDSGLFCAKEAINISKKIGYIRGIAFGYHRISQAFDFLGLSDSAFKYGNISQSYSRSIHDSMGLARSFFTFGNIYLYKAWYSEALKYYFDAYKIYQRFNDSKDMNDCCGSIAIIYNYTKEWRKSINYLMLTTNYERKTNDLLGLPEDYGNLGISFYDLGKYDSAYIYFKLAEKIALDTKNNRVLTAVYNNLGKIASDKNNFNLSIQYLTKSIQLNNESKNIEGLGENYIIMGDTYKKAGNKTMAIDCYNKGIEYCKQSKFNEDFVSGYYAISKLYEETGDIGKALSAYKMYVDINDTLVKRKYNNQVAQWQTLYELKNKEFQLTGAKNELTIQNIEIQKNKLLQRFLLAIVGIIALIFILVIRNIHHKRVLVKKENEIQKHKINELENERLLLATQSVLKGEDSERKRLARDLHDGLGGLLSGVKIALNNMKGNVVLSSDSVNDFNQALGMLDSSITELRRVAHNMMPEALMKLGLKDTLTDFCYELGKVNPMQIDFQFYGQFERVESNLEINIYRIIQELVNNAIKHADAKELVVQMIQEPKRLCFIVLDNGKGFELKEIEHTKGMGLASIKSRVDSFKGKIEIISKPGKGTEITIEFLI